MRLSLFKGWCISTLALLGSFYFMFEAGVLQRIIYEDHSNMTSVILAAFFAAYAYLGRLTYRSSVKGEEVADKSVDVGFEVADYLLYLGLIGTVIGLIIMMSSLHGIDLSKLENINQLFAACARGMSTAFFATVTGISSSVLLKASYYAFDFLRKK